MPRVISESLYGGNNERQNRPEGAQAGAQSQERGEDQSQAALVPEGEDGTGRDVGPGRPQGTVADAARVRTGVGALVVYEQAFPPDLSSEFITITNSINGETMRYRRPQDVHVTPRHQYESMAIHGNGSVQVRTPNGINPAPKPDHFKNPHERFCDLEAQCEGLRHELNAMREEMQGLIRHISGETHNRDAQQMYYEQQQRAMLYPPTMADYYQNGPGGIR